MGNEVMKESTRAYSLEAIDGCVTKHFLHCVVLWLIVLATTPAYAQLNGENLLGDTGVKNGSQPAPGLYVANLYYRYGTDTLKGADGERITFNPSERGSLTLHAIIPLVIYVSSAKVLGANYGMMAVMPFANAGLEAPVFGLDKTVSVGPSADISRCLDRPSSGTALAFRPAVRPNAASTDVQHSAPRRPARSTVA